MGQLSPLFRLQLPALRVFDRTRTTGHLDNPAFADNGRHAMVVMTGFGVSGGMLLSCNVC